MKRLTCSFPDPLAEKIEKMSEETGIPQSSVVGLAVKEYFDQKQVIDSMPKLLQLAQDLGKMDAQEVKKLLKEIEIGK
jgi:predicted DsbA family dithiol-disulfide isomerase